VSKLLVIGMGGFMGAAMRYSTGLLIVRWFGQGGFPYATFVVNFFGSLLIGFFLSAAGSGSLFSPTVQLFFITGLLGAFTTFSTFSYETWHLFQKGSALPALLNMGLHVLFGLAAVWVGSSLARLWIG